MCWVEGKPSFLEIPNSKIQDPDEFQSPKSDPTQLVYFGLWDFGHYLLFGAWNLVLD
jgi:hypothetical protein